MAAIRFTQPSLLCTYPGKYNSIKIDVASSCHATATYVGMHGCVKCIAAIYVVVLVYLCNLSASNTAIPCI